MGKETYVKKCKCGNSINIDTYHHAGGVNDKDKVILKCKECGNEFEDVIKNIESATITGATVVSQI